MKREYITHGKVIDIMKDMLTELETEDLISYHNNMSEKLGDNTKLVVNGVCGPFLMFDITD